MPLPSRPKAVDDLRVSRACAVLYLLKVGQKRGARAFAVTAFHARRHFDIVLVEWTSRTAISKVRSWASRSQRR